MNEIAILNRKLIYQWKIVRWKPQGFHRFVSEFIEGCLEMMRTCAEE